MHPDFVAANVGPLTNEEAAFAGVDRSDPHTNGHTSG